MTQNDNVAKSATMMMFEEENVERRLLFKPDPELNNLCLGYLDDVRIEERESPLLNEDGTENTWEYAGLKVPTLVLTFKQAKSQSNPKDRYYEHRFKPVTTKTKEGNPVDSKTLVNMITQEYARLRHITNQYKGLKTYPTNLGSCPGIDYGASAKVRCEQYLEYFKYFKALLDGTNPDQPHHKGVKLFIKLVADYSTGKFLAFPSFVGRGFVERVFDNQSPTIDFEPNETVQLNTTANKGKREAAAGAPATADTAPSEDIQNIISKYA